MFLLKDKVGVARESAEITAQVKMREEGEAQSNTLSDDGPLSKQTALTFKNNGSREQLIGRDGWVEVGDAAACMCVHVNECVMGGREQGAKVLAGQRLSEMSPC